jgi:hypothetical protein
MHIGLSELSKVERERERGMEGSNKGECICTPIIDPKKEIHT